MADSLSNRVLSAITSNPTAANIAGKVGKAIDVVGKALGNPLPDVGLSQQLESIGGYSQSQQATTPQQKAAIEQKAAERSGFNSAAAPTIQATNNPQPTNSGQQLSTDQLIQEYKNRGWTDQNAILANIAAGGYTGWNLGGSSNGGSAPKVRTSDVIAKTPGSQYLKDTDLSDLIKQYGEEVTGDTETLARAIEERAVAAADREYQSILGILGGQKEEVKTTAEEQRTAAKEQKTLTEADLTAKEEQETKAIGKEKEAFKEETTQTVETLARNWRDMSLEMQRIMRARGVSDSAFAAGKESDLLLNFNTGLRAIATKSTAALQDFSDAVDETVKFYTRQKANLDFQTNNQIKEIDAWERQQVSSIQAQETMAYNKKLDAIESAMNQADTLRVNVANQISEKKMAWGLWLVQMDYQYKTAVAEAAKTSVGNATTKVNEAKQLFQLTASILDNGGEIIAQKDSSGNITGGTVHGILPTTGEEIDIPITAGGTTNLLLKQAGNIYGTLNKNNETSNLINNTPALSNIYSQLTGQQQTTQTNQQTGGLSGIINAIKSAF